MRNIVNPKKDGGGQFDYYVNIILILYYLC